MGHQYVSTRNRNERVKTAKVLIYAFITKLNILVLNARGGAHACTIELKRSVKYAPLLPVSTVEKRMQENNISRNIN
jgi:hypothetical protein